MGQLKVVEEAEQIFSSRAEAGKILARELRAFAGSEAVVLGIPRGGVLVAWEISKAVAGKLDILLAHKLGAPGQPEVAVGAVCESGKVFVDPRVGMFVDKHYLEEEKKRQMERVRARAGNFRAVIAKLSLKDKLAIVTDDGVAMGWTMEAALWAARQENPRKLILALPVGPREVVERLAREADETVCLYAPLYFSGVSEFYRDFSEVRDEEVLHILELESRRRHLPEKRLL